MFKVPLAALASPLHNPEAVKSVINEYLSILKGLEPEFRVSWDESIITDVGGVKDFVKNVVKSVSDVPAVMAAVLTGGSEELIVELIGYLGPEYPVAVVPHKSMNSMAAAIEGLSRLRAEGFRSAYLIPLRKSAVGELKSFLRASAVKHRLRGFKLLCVGEPSPWLVHSSISGESLSLDLGVITVRVGLNEVLREFNSIGMDDIKGLISRFETVEREGIELGGLRRSLRLYVALKKVLTSRGGDALTIRCFDLITHGLTACLPLSMLNDEGIIAGCEGDVPAAITMAVLSMVSGKPSFMGNIAWVNESEGTILLTHCTAPTKPFKSFRLRTHYETGKGVAVEASPREGCEVTIARLDGRFKVLRAASGVIINSSPVIIEGCRTQLLIKVGNPSLVINEAVGNHYAVTQGNWVGELRVLANLIGYRFEGF